MYIPTTWATGDVITSTKLNNIEAGIVNAVDKTTAQTIAGAKTFTNPLTVSPNAGRTVALNQWGDVSSNSSGFALFSNNAYTDYLTGVYKYSQTHPSVGARGIRLSAPGGVEYFDTGSIATTADAEFTPTWLKSWHDGNRPAVKVTHSIAQSIPNDIPTTLAFNSETYDTDTIHDTVTNNSRLTCKTAGKYLISASLTYAANATGYREVDIILNAATVIASTTFVNIGVSATTSIQATVVYNLAVNDYVEVQAYQNSGGALNVERAINYSPDFSMVKVG